jgi:hypothetical protein
VKKYRHDKFDASAFGEENFDYHVSRNYTNANYPYIHINAALNLTPFEAPKHTNRPKRDRD